MSLTMKRNWHLIVISILFLLVLCYFGTSRVISINIWDKWEITTDLFDIGNTIDLFDTTQVHEIQILMTAEEYKDMIDTYANTSQKDRYKTDIVIDWVTISDVWIRLKWNSSLKWIWWNDEFNQSFEWMDRWNKKQMKFWSGNQMMMWYHGNMMRWGMQRNEVEKFGSWENEIPLTPLNEGGQPWMQFPWAFEWWSFWPGMSSGDSIDYDSQLPLFIKFNKYENQTYQWHEMIALRVWWMWSDSTLLAEPYSYELYQEAWQPAPDTSYWAVKIDGQDKKLFVISELPEDEYYIQKWFWNDNWVLYKAWNFINFTYLWEDPTVYSDYFTQKTRVNDYDFAPLIRLLKFISESEDEEFESEIDSYIDVESVLTLLAIDDFVGNNDSFGWMWSNYYLYYHLWEKKFYILTWDQNLAFGWMGGWFGWGGFWWGNFGWMSWFNMWLWMNPSVISTQSEANEEKSTSNIKDDTTIDFSAKPRNDDSNTSKKDRNNTQMPSDFPVGEQWWFPWMDAMSFWTEGEESKNNIQDSPVTSSLHNDEDNWQALPDFQWWGWESDFMWWLIASWDKPQWKNNFWWELSTPLDFQNWVEMSWFTWWDMPHFPWWEWMWWEWFSWWGWHWWSNRNGDNELKTRLLANEKFKAMYDEIYAEIEGIALNSDFSENFFAKWTNAFLKYNKNNELISESTYSQWVEKLKSYLANKKE